MPAASWPGTSQMILYSPAAALISTSFVSPGARSSLMSSPSTEKLCGAAPVFFSVTFVGVFAGTVMSGGTNLTSCSSTVIGSAAAGVSAPPAGLVTGEALPSGEGEAPAAPSAPGSATVILPSIPAFVARHIAVVVKVARASVDRYVFLLTGCKVSLIPSDSTVKLWSGADIVEMDHNVGVSGYREVLRIERDVDKLEIDFGRRGLLLRLLRRLENR